MYCCKIAFVGILTFISMINTTLIQAGLGELTIFNLAEMVIFFVSISAPAKVRKHVYSSCSRQCQTCDQEVVTTAKPFKTYRIFHKV